MREIPIPVNKTKHTKSQTNDLEMEQTGRSQGSSKIERKQPSDSWASAQNSPANLSQSFYGTQECYPNGCDLCDLWMLRSQQWRTARLEHLNHNRIGWLSDVGRGYQHTTNTSVGLCNPCYREIHCSPKLNRISLNPSKSIC